MAEISLKDALHSIDEASKNAIELEVKYTFFEQLVNYIC